MYRAKRNTRQQHCKNAAVKEVAELTEKFIRHKNRMAAIGKKSRYGYSKRKKKNYKAVAKNSRPVFTALIRDILYIPCILVSAFIEGMLCEITGNK